MKEMIMELLHWVIDLGYLGIALALMIEVIPSEFVLAYGGFMVQQGKFHFTAVILAGTIGGTLAQIFLYWFGYYGGRPFLEKYGKYMLIHKKHLDLSEVWFKKYGTAVIFFARFIPVVRHAISIPAGISKMSLTRFTVYTVLAVVPWSILFVFIGAKLGENWRQIKDVAGPYVDVLATGIVLGFVLYLVVKHRQNRFKP